MRRFHFFGIAFLVPALALLTFGCGKPTSPGGGGTPSPTQDVGKATGGPKTPLEVTEVATLKGKVTYDGDPPASKDIPVPSDHKDKDHCLKGDSKDLMWVIGAGKGVGGVVVWLRAPEGKYLQIPDDQKKRTDAIVIDQPFCNFKPHIVAVYPSYWDPKSKKQVRTGQVFKIINSAPILHNTAWKGNILFNAGKNENMPPKTGEMPIPAKPSSDTVVGGEDLITIACDIHKFMNAKAVAFDHPFHAVTKEDGSYEIKGAPAGVALDVVIWHETFGISLRKDAKTVTMTLKAGENTKDFKIK